MFFKQVGCATVDNVRKTFSDLNEVTIYIPAFQQVEKPETNKSDLLLAA